MCVREEHLWCPSHSDKQLTKGAKLLQQSGQMNLEGGLFNGGTYVSAVMSLTDEAVDEADLSIALAN